MEYNTSGIRTKRISDEMTYSYMPKQLCYARFSLNI